jgi:hypothetical protein
MATAPINIMIDALFEGILSAPLADEYKLDIQARQLRQQQGNFFTHVADNIRGGFRNSISHTHKSNRTRTQPSAERNIEEGDDGAVVLNRQQSTLSNRIHALIALPDVTTRTFSPPIISSRALASVVNNKTFGPHAVTESAIVVPSKIATTDNASFDSLENGQIHKCSDTTTDYASFHTNFIEQYKRLSGDIRLDFKDHWGFDPVNLTWSNLPRDTVNKRRGEVHPDGLDYLGSHINANPFWPYCKRKGGQCRERLITQAIAEANSQANEKEKKLKVATDMQIGLEILHLFIIDLLGWKTPAGKIFQSMTEEDFKHSLVVTKTSKIMAWSVVFLINLFFVFFTVLRGMTSSVKWQQTFLLGAILQMLIEILLFETMECLWIHRTIPRLVSAEVAASIATVKDAVNLAFKNENFMGCLDTPRYFFVSRKLAEKFPSSFESSVVLSFQSYFPPSELDFVNMVSLSDHTIRGQDSLNQDNFVVSFIRRFNLSATVMVLLRHLGTAPIRMQQIVMHTLQPIILSFVVLLYFFLLRNPMVSLVLLVIVVYESVAYVWKNSRHKKIIPVINDARRNTLMMNGLAKEWAERRQEEDNQRELEKTLFNDTKNIIQSMNGFMYSISQENQSKSSGFDGVRDSVSSSYEDIGIFNNFQFSETASKEKLPNERSISNVQDGNESLTTMADKYPSEQLELLETNFRNAKKAVEDYLIMEGIKTPADFEFQWDKNCDTYKRLYDPHIHSFVDETGRLVSVADIIARRNMEKEFNKNTNEETEFKVKQDIKRQAELAFEWDTYRLYNSVIVLPFIDRYGRYNSEKKILSCRRNIRRNDDGKDHEIITISMTTDLDLLLIEKQQREHDLMLWNRRDIVNADL